MSPQSIAILKRPRRVIGILSGLTYFGGWAIALPVPFLMPSAIAQTSIQTSAQCRQERDQSAQAQVYSLLDQSGRDLTLQRPRLAVRHLRQALQHLGRIDDAPIKAALLQTILTEPTGGDPNRFQQVLAKAIAQVPDTVPSLLADATQVVQTLPADFSAPKVQLLTAIAPLYQSIHQPERALALLTQARQATHTIQATDVRFSSAISLADAYRNLDQSTEAIALLQQAQTLFGQIPADQRENSALSLAMGYAKANQIQAATALLPQLSEDAYVLGELVRAHGRLGQIDAALQLAQTIPIPSVKAIALANISARVQAGQEPSPVAASTLAEAVRISRSLSDGGQTLSEVLQINAPISPDILLAWAEGITTPETRANILGQAAIAEEAAGRFNAALLDQALAAIQAIGADWQVFQIRHLIDDAIAAGAYQTAVRLANGPNNASYNGPDRLVDIVQHALAAHQPDAALSVLAAIAPNQGETLGKALAAIAVADVQADQAAVALQRLDRLPQGDAVERVRVLAAIAGELQRNQQVEQARPLFEQAAQIANGLSQPEFAVQALGLILAQRPPDQATLVTQFQQTARRITDAFLASQTLGPIVDQLTALQQFDVALAVADTLPVEYERSSYRQSVQAIALQWEQYEFVLQQFDRNAPPETQVSFLLTLSDRYRIIGEDERANELLAETVPLVRQIADPESRVLTFGPDEQPTIIEDENDRASLAEMIGLRYAQQGQIDQALLVAGIIESPSLREQVNQRILCYR